MDHCDNLSLIAAFNVDRSTTLSWNWTVAVTYVSRTPEDCTLSRHRCCKTQGGCMSLQGCLMAWSVLPSSHQACNLTPTLGSQGTHARGSSSFHVICASSWEV